MRTFPSAFLFIVSSVALLVIPLPWLAAWFLAILIHELGHYIALRICKISVHAIRMKLSGVQMDTGPMSAGQELICSLAGPLCGFSLLLFAKYIPRVAVCAAIQSCYNLLPLYPLDGGRGVRCVLQMLCSTNISMVEKFIRFGCVCVLIILGVVATFVLKLGTVPVLLVIWILCKHGNLKTPCKDAKQIVQ